MDTWDDEFNAFYRGLDKKPGFDECFEACSRVNDILKDDINACIISGSMTRQAMIRLKDIFPELTDEEALELAQVFLHKRLDSFFAPPPPGSDPVVMDLYRRALKRNDAKAQHDLGIRYGQGAGVKRNYAEAAKWHRLAAEQGNAESQHDLGIRYGQGAGVKRNYAEAVKWHRLAAEQGNAESHHVLGVLYANGWGVSQNYAEAVKWHRLAAEQGNAEAQYNMGYCYEHGCVVSEDKAEAAKWHRLAAEQGNEEARENLERLKQWSPFDF
jgi:TPR repeat protein